MRNNEIDKILSIIDNLFGEDDNSAVPDAFDMRNSGFGDEHRMAKPIYGCDMIAKVESTLLHPDPEINSLLEYDGSLFESGMELYREREAYTDSAESLAEWEEELNHISQERAQLGSRINGLIAIYDARS